MIWLAFPPVGLWPLAWFAPVCWLHLISRSELPGKQPYLVIYLAGYLHWLLMVQWVRLPHWLAFVGWWFLAAYLAAYVPLFIGISRILVHRWKCPSILAAPVVWTGLELGRGYFLTGFSLQLLGHSQAGVPHVIQIADLFGAYGVSFLLILVAASIERLVPLRGRPSAVAAPALVIAASLTVSLSYGFVRLSKPPPQASEGAVKVALIQGAYDTKFDGDSQRAVDAFMDYLRLSKRAVDENRDVDLIVWPESMFTANEPIVSWDEPLRMVPLWEGSVEELQDRLNELNDRADIKAKWVARETQSELLVGSAWEHLTQGTSERLNAAVLIDRDGRIVDHYAKMHPVMFGEYLPLGQWFPWLYRWTPMGDGLTAGRNPKSYVVNGVRFAPSICFENTVPQLIRRQLNTLAAAGEEPDAMVTITNDGWFWGSSLLDVHLACGTFRAVEMRRPMLIAANTGFSAHIDLCGRVLAKGPRRQEGLVVAKIEKTSGTSPYRILGDSFAFLCLLVALGALVLESAARLRDRSQTKEDRAVSGRQEA